MKNNINFLRSATKVFLSLAVALLINSCESAFKFELPEANSKVDTVLPAANFSYAASGNDFKTIKFQNLSFEATTYLWDFGGGNTSTQLDPTFTFADGEGTYPVTLTASDARGAASSKTIEVKVVKGPFRPTILEPGFEDNTLPDGSGDGRDSWRVSWATIFGISSSPVTFGSQAGKLEISSARAGYQEITVEPNTNYDLGFWYTMTNTASDPWAIVSIVGVTENGPIDSKQKAIDGTIASITVNDTSVPATYVKEKLSFNSGNNNTVAIYFYNDANVEARFDDFTIEIGAQGAVPPSANFTFAQSASNSLEYSFTNASINATTYEWDFGDGSTSTDESPMHVYSSYGLKTVKLTSKNSAGLTASISRPIDIQAPVTADFTYMTDAGNYKKYFFTDASVGAVSLLWNFGDGYSSSLSSPMHIYEADGSYTVTLTATSVSGKTSIKTESIAVSAGFLAEITDPDVTSTTAWRNTALEASADLLYGDGTWVVQTSSTFYSGGANSLGAKLPTYESEGSYGAGDDTPLNRRRWIYQAIKVKANTNYTISWFMRNKDAGAGATVTAQIRNAPFDDASLIDNPGATLIKSQIYNAASGHDVITFAPASISFNSGSSTEIVLFIFNDYTLNVENANSESESYLDFFSIVEN